jgi:hypoxanthine-guanine phosphoribosyltransferase
MAIEVYYHEQLTPSTTWAINHNLGEDVVIVDAIVDIGGTLQKMFPIKVEMIDTNNTVVTFSQAYSGYSTVI